MNDKHHASGPAMFGSVTTRTGSGITGRLPFAGTDANARLPEEATFRCLSLRARERRIDTIGRIDLQTDSVFGDQLRDERQGTYDPSGLRGSVCAERDIESAVWRPGPPDALVIASRGELDLVPRCVVRGLPVIVLDAVAEHLWPGAGTDLVSLCHLLELPKEPARAMPATLVRAWRIGQITRAALQAVFCPERLVAISGSRIDRDNRHMRRRNKAR